MFTFGRKPSEDSAGSEVLEHPEIEAAAQSVIENAPPVSDNAEQFSNENSDNDSQSVSNTSANPSDGSRDSSGTVFDSNLHAVGTDGSGVKTAAGLWRKKRKSKVAGAEKPAKVASNSEMDQAAKANAARTAGVVTAQMTVQMCAALFGPEWIPRVISAEVPDGKGGHVKMQIDEMANQENVWSQWFLATGRTDVPPNVALVLGLSMYVLPRFTMPQTKAKLGNFRQWIAHKWLSLKFRKKQPEPAK